MSSDLDWLLVVLLTLVVAYVIINPVTWMDNVVAVAAFVGVITASFWYYHGKKKITGRWKF